MGVRVTSRELSQLRRRRWKMPRSRRGCSSTKLNVEAKFKMIKAAPETKIEDYDGCNIHIVYPSKTQSSQSMPDATTTPFGAPSWSSFAQHMCLKLSHSIQLEQPIPLPLACSLREFIDDQDYFRMLERTDEEDDGQDEEDDDDYEDLNRRRRTADVLFLIGINSEDLLDYKSNEAKGSDDSRMIYKLDSRLWHVKTVVPLGCDDRIRKLFARIDGIDLVDRRNEMGLPDNHSHDESDMAINMFTSFINNRRFRRQAEEVLESADNLFKRYDSDDALYAMLMVMNMVVEIPLISQTKRDMGINDLVCIVGNCGKEVVNCMTDESCAAAIREVNLVYKLIIQ